MQFEVLTTYLNDGGKLPQRGSVQGTAHAYLSAPYGIYKTSDGYLAIAMGNLLPLMNVLHCTISPAYENSEAWFEHRDEIVQIIADALKNKTTPECLALLAPLQIWCAEVFNYKQAAAHEGYKVLQVEQEVKLDNGRTLKTTRCPIVIDGHKLYSSKAAPKVGMDTDVINKEFELTKNQEN
jgi:crotonobetainyl-CoA:carnitine CoA-transferase CaiB-like acyl-CoA transferase